MMDMCDTPALGGILLLGARAQSRRFRSAEGEEFETFRHLHIFPTIVFLKRPLIAVREGLHAHMLFWTFGEHSSVKK